jgi:UPF0042 nucleotide-binding protein
MKSPTFLPKPVNSHKLRIIIITGLAGAGKSTALNAFEDMGYYAIDNLPVFLLKELQAKAGTEHLHNRKLALVMDCRDPSFLPSFTPVVMQSSSSVDKEILFLDCNEEVLLRRFSQLRRQHPLATEGSIREAVIREKVTLQPLLTQATRVIDTSRMTPHELARQLRKIYDKQESADRFVVNLMSFGFKHGPPAETDTIWDVRFLPNPYFVPELKPYTGLDERVAQYVLENETSRRFFALLEPLLEFLIPQYRKEGKAQFTIGIGCTGGKHRSVAVTEKLKQFLSRQNVKLFVDHRDIDKA